MAGRSPTIKVTVLGDAGNLKKMFQDASREAETFGAKMGRWGTTLTRSVTLPIVGLGAIAVKAASDLNEAIDATTVIFGDAADSVLAWSESAAENMGVARDAALTAAGSFGNMFEGAGLAQQQAAEMATTLAQRAADVGSLFNVDPQEMLGKFQSALAGEAEPLRRFGVNISAAKIKTKAFELGLLDADGQLTDSGKIQAIYALILEGTATAAGNVRDTADGMANKTRIAKAKFHDLAGELGNNLIPLASTLVGQLSGIASGFAGLSSGAQTALVDVALLVAVSGPLAKLFSLLSKIGPLLTGIGTAFGTTAGVASAAIGVIAAAVAGLIVALKEVKTLEEQQEARDTTRREAAAAGFPTFDPRVHWDSSPLQTAGPSGGTNYPMLSSYPGGLNSTVFPNATFNVTTGGDLTDPAAARTLVRNLDRELSSYRLERQ